jgi:hypothetical protein
MARHTHSLQICGSCGEWGSGTHRCLERIPRGDWQDVAGSVARFVALKCPRCGDQITSDSVQPDTEPATSYGVVWCDCATCDRRCRVLLVQWPLRPVAVSRGYTGTRGSTYGT